MLSVKNFTVENMAAGCVTDNPNPRFSYYLESDRKEVTLKQSVLTMGDWKIETDSQIAVPYDGPPLKPYTKYTVNLQAIDNKGEKAEASVSFETGRLYEPWLGTWITDGSYRFTKKHASPAPMTFRRIFIGNKEIEKGTIYATALGIYELTLNGDKVGEDYFAPGFTSYKNQLQYQTYDITTQIQNLNELIVSLAGGWAVGAFTYKRRNRVFAKRQAFLCEVHILYKDGTKDIITTDDSWQVTMSGNYREAEFYNGEVYDACVDLKKVSWHAASLEKPGIKPVIMAQYGSPVRSKEVLKPVSSFQSKSGILIYDFGQNFAGVISAKIKGSEGQKIIFSHAEILMDGELYTKPLRTAKQQAVYISRDGEQTYSPRMTYMGFRYVGVSGINQENLELSALALYSDIENNGDFSCSDERVNRLQKNIVWSAKSNFVDIPTDCPQRDERMGWTGDIALFSKTAVYNFDITRFLNKWLLDVKAEQTLGGGIPVTVPLVRVPNQWEIMIPMAVDHWGDACILVPWAMYLSKGDKGILTQMYPVMKRYMKACEFWAGLFSIGRHKRIWKLLHHYGDWCAPGVSMWGWMRRGKWTATACMANSSGILSKIASILEKDEDAAYYKELSLQTAETYRNLLMDKDCLVKNEFQTAYVLPLYYEMLQDEDRKKTAAHLARMVRKNQYHIGTGFPGTPFVLFALADNGYQEDACKMLLTDTCPSWLYEGKVGGTTIWERWDALREDGTCNTGDDDGTGGMVSFNHYASGAVGDFLYRRIAGIEALEGGYKTFHIAPVPGKGISWATGSVMTAFGRIASHWRYREDGFFIEVEIPAGTTCHLTLPGGSKKLLGSGKYSFLEQGGSIHEK